MVPSPELDLYYRDCVIGGPGAFMVVARGFNDFARAIRRKLFLELSGWQPAPRRVRAALRPPVDCLIGEKRTLRELQELQEVQELQEPSLPFRLLPPAPLALRAPCTASCSASHGSLSRCHG